MTRIAIASLLLVLIGWPWAARAAQVREVASASALEAAIAEALPGDEIVVAAGTYDLNLVIRRSGAPGAPITLRAADGATVVLQAADRRRRVIELDGASHWRLQRLHVRGSRHAMIRIEGGTDNWISDCEIYDGSKKGIIANGDAITIERSVFRDIKTAGDDTQAIAAWRASRLRIRDNTFASPGDGVLLGGAGALGVTPTDVRIYRNHFHARQAWYGRWRVENAIDVKDVDGLLIADNVIHRYRGDADNDGGVAMNFHTPDVEDTDDRVEHVTVEGNVIYDVGRVAHVKAIDGPGRDFVFRRNVVHTVKAANGSAEKPPGGLIVGPWEDVKIDHNTWVDVDRVVLHAYGELVGLRFRNNLLHRTGGVVREPPAQVLADFTCRSQAPDLGGAHDVVGDPRFVDEAARDFALAADSPCLDRGTDLGLPFLGAAPDLGRWERDPAEALLADPGDAPAPPPSDGRAVDWAREPSPDRQVEEDQVGPELEAPTPPGLREDVEDTDDPAGPVLPEPVVQAHDRGCTTAPARRATSGTPGGLAAICVGAGVMTARRSRRRRG